MKKNVMMRVAAFLMVCVLASTCGISGTFAKYVSAGNASAEARVAMWGVTIDVTAENAFSTTYAADDTVIPGTDNTVVSSTTEELVAPGTEGTLFTMNIEGQPEVDTVIEITADLELVGWTLADDSIYCPIVFHIGSTDYAWDSGLYTSLDEFEEVIENAILAYHDHYFEANTDLSTVMDLEISWSWAFEQGTTPAEIADFDAKDTYLGDCAAGIILGKAASTISLDMTITITQVD